MKNPKSSHSTANTITVQADNSGVKLPVSAKFYRYITERLTDAALLYDDISLHDKMMTAVSDYLYHGTLPSVGSPKELLIVFMILKPEIDKAIARSMRARCRKTKRVSRPEKQTEKAREKASEKTGKKAGKTASVGCQALRLDSVVDSDMADLVEDDPVIRLNRRERRLEAMEFRRMLKKRVKPLAGKRS